MPPSEAQKKKRRKKTAVKKTAVKRILRGDYKHTPSTLTHYTNLVGMMGIIDSGEIWASNVSFLNDRRELTYGLEATERVIKKFTTKETYADWHATLEKVLARLSKGKIPNTYAACFCQKSDALSQWRAYGGTEQGVAIVFDRMKLAKVLKVSEASLYPVVYGQLDAASQITQELSEQLDDLEEAEDDSNHSEETKMSKANSIICRLLPQFKHIGFKDEMEWRFVVQQESMRSSVSFRANSNVMIPFLKLSLGEKRDLPIKHLLVGPERDQELTRRSLELYLRGKLNKEVGVRLSSVPY